jgi:hypothetical protein
MGIHFLHYVHGNKRIGTHETICATFTTIVRNACFHVGREQLYVLPSTTFNSSRRQFDIVLTKNGICTLADIIIADPTRMDLLPQSCTTQRFVASDVTQVKEMSYRSPHPIDQFFPLAIEVFGCLHKHVDVFYTTVLMPFGV